jgi:hypothetical protein
MNRYTINDRLTALAQEAGVDTSSLRADEVLNELTHTVADAFEQLKPTEEFVGSWSATPAGKELATAHAGPDGRIELRQRNGQPWWCVFRPVDEDRECDERCARHAPDCDGYCDHIRHVNQCQVTA